MNSISLTPEADSYLQIYRQLIHTCTSQFTPLGIYNTPVTIILINLINEPIKVFTKSYHFIIWRLCLLDHV